MIGLLKNKSQYYTKKEYIFLVRDRVQYPRIFPIHSRIIFVTISDKPNIIYLLTIFSYNEINNHGEQVVE